MARTAIVYTTTTGNTQYVAELLQRQYGASLADLMDLTQIDLSILESYDNLVCCVSTWGRSDMQDDWEALTPKFQTLNLRGKRVAILGLGDQKNYPNAFADGARKLADIIRGMGIKLVGRTATSGYTYNVSKAVEDGLFLGLILDEDNQHEQTLVRLRDWIAQLKREFTA